MHGGARQFLQRRQFATHLAGKFFAKGAKIAKQKVHFL